MVQIHICMWACGEIVNYVYIYTQSVVIYTVKTLLKTPLRHPCIVDTLRILDISLGPYSLE